MTIGMRQGSVVTEIGPGELLHSLFSTIAVHLEGGQWGANFPLVMNKLYQGNIPAVDVDLALAQAHKIRDGLRLLAPDKVIWDIENLQQDPPWGRKSGTHVKSMADYFVTTTGRNLVDEIIDNLDSLKEFGGSLEIISYTGMPPF